MSHCILELLVLGSTFLTGTIPEEAAQLTDLGTYVTRMKGLQYEPYTHFPARLLENLSLSLSQLSGSIPSSFGNLLMLEKLTLAVSGATAGTIPTELGHLTNLRKLSLSVPGVHIS